MSETHSFIQDSSSVSNSVLLQFLSVPLQFLSPSLYSSSLRPSIVSLRPSTVPFSVPLQFLSPSLYSSSHRPSTVPLRPFTVPLRPSTVHLSVPLQSLSVPLKFFSILPYYIYPHVFCSVLQRFLFSWFNPSFKRLSSKLSLRISVMCFIIIMFHIYYIYVSYFYENKIVDTIHCTEVRLGPISKPRVSRICLGEAGGIFSGSPTPWVDFPPPPTSRNLFLAA